MDGEIAYLCGVCEQTSFLPIHQVEIVKGFLQVEQILDGRTDVFL